MPVNMPTHAHGQGYTDLNWLIPELIDRIDYRKGPYSPDEGDFASAGSARIRLSETLPRGHASASLGADRFARGLIANSTAVGGGDLLYALEFGHADGPWEHPENFRHASAVLRCSAGDADNRSSLTAMGYSARWAATNQVPMRAVDSGLIGRFGAIDASDHGNTSRYSLSYIHPPLVEAGGFNLRAYALHSPTVIFSTFP